jgi:hypothetical protein
MLTTPARSRNSHRCPLSGKIKGGFATRAAPAFWRGTFDDGHDNRLKSARKRSFKAGGRLWRLPRRAEAPDWHTASD